MRKPVSRRVVGELPNPSNDMAVILLDDEKRGSVSFVARTIHMIEVLFDDDTVETALEINGRLIAVDVSEKDTVEVTKEQLEAMMEDGPRH